MIQFTHSSLRGRLWLSFLSFTVLLIAIVALSLLFYLRTDWLYKANTLTSTILMDVLEITSLERDFFTYEVLDTNFYIRRNSPVLQRHAQTLDSTAHKIKTLEALLRTPVMSRGFGPLHNSLKEVNTKLEAYQASFQKLINYTLVRGFRDYGLEGVMRRNAHRLEDLPFGLEKAELLMLRRHEKDYIIRKDLSYVHKFNRLYQSLRNQQENNTRLSPIQKKEVIITLDKYHTFFNRVVKYEGLIGLSYAKGKGTGQKSKIKYYGDQIVSEIEALQQQTNLLVEHLKKQHYVLFLTFAGMAVVLSLGMAYWFSRRLTQPFEQLTGIIERSIEADFYNQLEQARPSHITEVQRLNHSFNMMLSELRHRLYLIEEKNFELAQQNEELNAINGRILESESRLVKLNAVKNKFFSIISHDLRSPLHNILGFLRVLESDFSSFTFEEVMRFSEETQKSVTRLIDLLENLLQWSMSETDEIRFEPKKLSLSEVIAENVALYQKNAEGKGIQLKYPSPDELQVYADPNMLNFVFRNLLSNAIKFSFPNTRIQIEVRPQAAWVEIAVCDQGIGIKPEALEKIFQTDEHFTTLGTQKEKGTGFGLLLCKNFIERNGGEIHLESQYQKGTTVLFTVPLVVEAGILAT
ncbi:MAG: HAMP domain-containing histidine kinase [Microscillaceae bacterium]|nr:HAMP domain-containing histidine kinase [Microscillaceae bacterium]